MNIASNLTELKLKRDTHYQSLLEANWSAANFPTMPGYQQDDGITELRLSPYSFNAILKVSRGDPLNICAMLSVALNILTRYYSPSDYPLCYGYSLVQGPQNNNFLLLQSAFAPEDTVAQWILAHRQRMTALLELGDTSFPDIQHSLGTRSVVSGLFSIHLNVRTEGAARSARPAQAMQIDFDIAAEGHITLLADPGLYPAVYRHSILRNFAAVLEQIAQAPKQQIKDVQPSCPEEQAITQAFAQGEKRDFTQHQRLEHMLEARAEDMPDKLAVISENTHLSYQQLNSQANIIGWNLIDKGVQPGDTVAIMLQRNSQMLAAIYGVLKAGACYVPVDPNYPETRRTYILEDSQARFVIVEDGVDVPATFSDRALLVTSFTTTAQGTRNPGVSDDSRALAYMIYTSGSTGNPKGVMIEHRSVFNRIEWMQNCYGLSQADVILQKTPISFDVSVWELFWWTFVGASVSMLKRNGEKEPETILATIARDRITHMHFVPSMLDAFLNSIDPAQPELASLEIVFTSGEALTLHQSERFFSLVGTHWGSRLVNLYGPTEATVDVTAYECQSGEKRASIPIGRPIQNTGILILDSQLRHTSIGVAGELCISGDNLARGYLNRPELTEEKFCELPEPIAQRVYRSGDLVRWLEDGQIEYLGRIDDQVKIRGYRIELGEIEATIQQSHYIKDVRVIALVREDGSKFLVAYVRPDLEYNELQVREDLLASLPEFMVPAYFVKIDQFPMTPNGKLDKSKLPNPQKIASLREKVLPQSDLEKTLATIWSEALGIEQIGIHDSFFSLGGDSITSLGVISRARKQGFEISFQQMFSHPTIAGIIPLLKSAVTIEEETYRAFSLVSANDQVKLPILIEDAYPLTLLQAGLIFQSELQKGASWYHDIQVYTLNGTFNPTAFRRAAQRMVEEHAILRTSYHLNEYQEFIQIVHQDMPLPLYIEDWSGVEPEQQALQLEQFIEQESHYQFDWQTPGLIRIHIQVLSEQNFRYILSFHDSTLDGWSINLLHTKLLRYYHLACVGEIPTVDFTDNFLRKYVVLERMTRRDTAAQNYWRNALLGYEPMPLPRLRSKSSDIPHIEYHDVDISTELSDGLRQLASKLGVPVKSVLLSAHLRVLSLLVNAQQVVTGYEHSGRPEEENVDQAIGLFLNSIPFLTRLIADESWAQLIGRVHRQEAEFLPYRRFPMADMKVQLQTTETLFETVFNFTHFHMLKELRTLPGMNALDVRVRAETEFVLRAEFSQNSYTDQVEFSLHYHSNEFDAAHIQRIGEYYLNALLAISADSEQSYSSVDLMSEAEKAQLDQLGRGAQRALPELSAIHGIFEQAKQHPEKIALKDTHESISFAALVEQVRATSNLLPPRTATQAIVAIAIPRSVAWITAMVGVMAAGAVYMPLDPDSPDARILDLLEEGKVSHLMCDIEQQARFAELVSRHNLAISVHSHNTIGSGAQTHSLPSMSDLAYVLFTSGSTGKPKGALLEHQGMLNHMLAKIEDLQMHVGDVLAQTAPVTFDVSVWQALTGLLCGAQTIVYTKDVQLDPGLFCARLKQDQVSILEIVPSYFALLLEHLEQHPTDLGALHTLIQTGEALKHELVARWFALYPHIKLVNAYGPTEASDDITHHIFTAPPQEPIVPIGKPVQNMWIHILNSQDQLVPFGTPGEICVSGIGVGRGYINAPDKTEAAFDFDHPLAAWSIGRLYRTGDIGKWFGDGSLAYMGRKDEQVKIRGMRIEIGEVENTLLSIDKVLNAAVVLQERPEGARLVAFVQGQVDPVDVHEVAATLLPDFMLPEHILHCSELPLNAAGKIDKKTLLQWCETQVTTSDKVLELPQGQLEQDLAQQWADLLRLPLASIGRDSNFFALGGNSLLAMSAAMRSHGQYSITDLFTKKSLAQLVRHITLASNSKLPVLQQLTDCTQGLTLVCFSYAGGNAINFQEVAHALRSKVDVRVLAAEPPGNDPSRNDDLIDVADMVRLCVQELQQQGIDDVVVWGHCSGCGAASEFAAQASAARIKVRQLVFSGKVLRPEITLQEQIAQTQANSDEQTLQWLIDVSGLDLQWGQDKNLQARLARAYRNDAVGANRILSKIWQGTLRLPVPAPLLCLLAEDDPLTQGSEQLADNWRQLTDDVRVACLPEGGHYFMKTQAVAVSDILMEILKVEKNT